MPPPFFAQNDDGKMVPIFGDLDRKYHLQPPIQNVQRPTWNPVKCTQVLVTFGSDLHNYWMSGCLFGPSCDSTKKLRFLNQHLLWGHVNLAFGKKSEPRNDKTSKMYGTFDHCLLSWMRLRSFEGGYEYSFSSKSDFHLWTLRGSCFFGGPDPNKPIFFT